MFDWKWYLKDIIQDKPVTVFSCFSCGGGSSMGYKRVGFDVRGNLEIDKTINEIYIHNLHPKHNFCMDIRDFVKLGNYPEDLMNLDILDGSPPCTTFSMAGDREKSWGKYKKFAEGQKLQRLDDLFFEFIKLAGVLRPKIIVAENVAGLLYGNAAGYVNEIIKGFSEIGYSVQIFKLNSAIMDVPQARIRVFFIANRLNFPPLKLKFNSQPILFGEVRSAHGSPIKRSCLTKYLLDHRTTTDKWLSDINLRLFHKKSMFNHQIVHDNDVAGTLTASSFSYRGFDGLSFSDDDIRNCSTFPQDYNFLGKSPQFICGMCVPPNMMASLADNLWRQWLSPDKNN